MVSLDAATECVCVLGVAKDYFLFDFKREKSFTLWGNHFDKIIFVCCRTILFKQKSRNVPRCSNFSPGTRVLRSIINHLASPHWGASRPLSCPAYLYMDDWYHPSATLQCIILQKACTHRMGINTPEKTIKLGKIERLYFKFSLVEKFLF